MASKPGKSLPLDPLENKIGGERTVHFRAVSPRSKHSARGRKLGGEGPQAWDAVTPERIVRQIERAFAANLRFGFQTKTPAQ
jgi:hypothetical protein